jgi:hypothetical protein
MLASAAIAHPAYLDESHISDVTRTLPVPATFMKLLITNDL